VAARTVAHWLRILFRDWQFDTDCVLKLREEIEILAEQLLEMAKKSPPALKENDTFSKPGE